MVNHSNRSRVVKAGTFFEVKAGTNGLVGLSHKDYGSLFAVSPKGAREIAAALLQAAEMADNKPNAA